MMLQNTKDRCITISTSLSFATLLLIIPVLMIPIFVQSLGPGNPSCWELGTCDLFSHPLDAMLTPWTDDFGPIAYVLIWGLILGIIWLRTHNTMMVGVVGIMIAGLYTFAGLNSINPQILYVGAALLAVAVGVLVYQLFIVRLIYPTN